MISGETGVKDVIGGNRYIKIGSKEIGEALREMNDKIHLLKAFFFDIMYTNVYTCD